MAIQHRHGGLDGYPKNNRRELDNWRELHYRGGRGGKGGGTKKC
jgi:hypothetical protein